MNKTDAYINFDPTLKQGGSCCGSLYWDFDTQAWKQRPLVISTKVDCSQVQAELDQALKTIADLQNAIAQKDSEIAELKKQLLTRPTDCDVLTKYLDPVRRLNGEIIYYGLKNPPECMNGRTVNATGLAGDTITPVVP